jgi:hypothetical protein
MHVASCLPFGQMENSVSTGMYAPLLFFFFFLLLLFFPAAAIVVVVVVVVVTYVCYFRTYRLT